MMDKNSVTRTFSIGAICCGTNASDNFNTARRHSSAGIRALLWATSSAKSFGCSDSQTSRENIFSNILTPDSIPQFTIPSLSVQNSLRSLDKETEEDYAESEEGLGSPGTEPESSLYPSPACSTLSSSTSSSHLSLVLSGRKAERSVSDPFTQRRSLHQREVSYPCFYTEAQHCLDPASRAALSLPHLPKVTTPYGFITLSQSPQMASEEALLCQAGQRRLNKKRLSKDSIDSQNKGSVNGQTKASSASSNSATVSSSSTPRHADSKHKRRFYDVIKKHFTSSH